MFEGGKTRIFWWGLIIFGLSISVLFAIFWYVVVLDFGYGSGWRWWTPFVFSGVIFLLIGLYMMKSGMEKRESKA